MWIFLYAGLLSFLYILLAMRVINQRHEHQIGIGDGEIKGLSRAIRVHGNFAENVPFALLMILMLELANLGAFWIHGLGCTLLLGRVLHAYGVSAEKENLNYRVAGMLCTFAVLVISGSLLLILSPLGQMI